MQRPGIGYRLATAPGDVINIFRYIHRALKLVWQTSHVMMPGLALVTLVGGVLPAVAAWVGLSTVRSADVIMVMNGHETRSDHQTRQP